MNSLVNGLSSFLSVVCYIKLKKCEARTPYERKYADFIFWDLDDFIQFNISSWINLMQKEQ